MVQVYKYFSLAVLLFLVYYPTHGQTVTVSKEIGIKNDIAYDIFTDFPNRVMLYRDKGWERKFEIFDRDLRFLYSQDIILDHKKDKIAHISNNNEKVNLYYTHRNDDIFQLKAKSYNEDGSSLDTVLLALDSGEIFSKVLGSSESKDKSKVVFYRYHKKNLHCFIINNDSLDIYNHFTIFRNKKKFGDGIRNVLVSNSGELYLVLKSEFESGGKDNYLKILKVDSDGNSYISKLVFDDLYSENIVIDIDEERNQFLAAGLLEYNNEYQSDSYFLEKLDLNNWEGDHLVDIIPLDETFINKINSSNASKKSYISHYDFTDVLFRRDGGLILIGEYSKIIYRRSSYGGRGSRFGGRSDFRNLTDYYNEDVLVINMDNQNNVQWQRLLPKKQYSQDDGGYFSSFFILKTPSRLRMLYNDEIKTNSTVSEYVIDPMGNFERNSIVSTEYQDLRLRIQDAIQISSTEVLIPSEKSGKLNLVKINFQ